MMRWLRCRPQDGRSLLLTVEIIVHSSPNIKMDPTDYRRRARVQDPPSSSVASSEHRGIR
jgi:hypothetical protein